MKALVTGTPVEIEGEPAEIAQLVELMSSGAVFVEHKHRWVIPSSSDGNGIYQAKCWCGQERTMAPYAAESRGDYGRGSYKAGSAPAGDADTETTAAPLANKRPCGCGPKGKHLKTCALKAAGQ